MSERSDGLSDCPKCRNNFANEMRTRLFVWALAGSIVSLSRTSADGNSCKYVQHREIHVHLRYQRCEYQFFEEIDEPEQAFLLEDAFLACEKILVFSSIGSW
jgi:hypothetical protein